MMIESNERLPHVLLVLGAVALMAPVSLHFFPICCVERASCLPAFLDNQSVWSTAPVHQMGIFDYIDAIAFITHQSSRDP